MKRLGLELAFVLILVIVIAAGVTLGEAQLTGAQYLQAFTDPSSAPGQVLWTIRAPRACVAAAVGACLGLSGGLLQGLLRNPLADPGVLGVSACAALGAAIAIVAGLALTPGAIEVSALAGAIVGGALLVVFAARFPEPEALILFGVALSSFAGALMALAFNLSPSPVATSEVLSWLMGSVENRSWFDLLTVGIPLLVAGALAAAASQALRALTLGEETAQTLGLDMPKLKLIAIVAASIAAGASVAVAGVIGFVGLAAPHLVRAVVREDPARLLWPSTLAGAVLLVLADLVARLLPTAQELRLGVFTALVGAPLFALIAWRAARSWRT
jgi:iron complex transport system permease protein